jgi:S1-C subfamily serine protease
MKMKMWLVCAGLTILANGRAAAVDTQPPAAAPQLRMASVESLNLGSRFAVDRVKTAILAGETLGHVSRGGFICSDRKPVIAAENVESSRGVEVSTATVQLLKRLGFTLALPAKAYGNDEAAAPDYRVGAIIRDLKFDICINDTFQAEGWLFVKIDWALYSEREQKVVFQLTTDGLVNTRDKVDDIFDKAYTSAAENFIAAPGFLNAVKPDAAAQLAAASPQAAQATPKRVAAVLPDKPPAVTALKPTRANEKNLSAKLAVDPVKVALLPGDDVGIASYGDSCSGAKPLLVTPNLISGYGQFVATLAQQSLKSYGYPLASQAQASAFDTDVKDPARFRVGGVLKELKTRICTGRGGQEGWVYAKFDWMLYDDKAKSVVLQRVTEGVYASKDKIPDLTSRAFAMSFENFLASGEVLTAMTAAPPVETAQAAAAPASAASSTAGGAPSQSLVLAGGTVAPGGAQKNQARLRAAVVTLEAVGGMGSGFYIDREGYLLTNFHVVQGAKFVKVKLQNGDKLVAEVVKVSEPDDIALLKSAPVDLDPLAVRPDALDVGEDVFAIGTPLGLLDSTMTRGILSADRKIQGRHLLQSDAAVTFGSSGGPLLDSAGRVIGITRSGFGGSGGFNVFVPVQDALNVLSVSLRKN